MLGSGGARLVTAHVTMVTARLLAPELFQERLNLGSRLKRGFHLQFPPSVVEARQQWRVRLYDVIMVNNYVIKVVVGVFI